MVAESKRRKVFFLHTGWGKTEESSGFFVSQVEKGSTGQGRAGQGRAGQGRATGTQESWFLFYARTEAPSAALAYWGLHVY